jgi:phosphate transport system substrate-binding protein
MKQLLSRYARVGAVTLIVAAGQFVAPRAASASTSISGDGSSFAGIEFQQWETEVGAAPYNLSVNYQSSSSGLGRADFQGNLVDFAVSDIRYNPLDDQTPLPDPSTFAYVPITAGGIAFMYNLQKEGFSQSSTPIQLSSRSVCGIFTAAIPFWDDPAIQADNPGVTLPHTPVKAVVRNDAAGTNFVLAQYCLATQHDQWVNFINTYNSSQSAGAGHAFPTDQPTSSWPLLTDFNAETGSDQVANTVADPNNDGFIGAVETGYAVVHHFPVAAVKNDTGAYVLPSAAAVAEALGHATQQTDGTQQLNFTPNDPTAYNPSTYSYMLVRLTGRSNAIGASVTAFANYCLTIGEEEAPSLGYATINRSLIEFALNRLQAVPGYVAPTPPEQAAVPQNNQNTNPTTIPASVTSTSSNNSSTNSTNATTGTNSNTTGTNSGSASTDAANAGAGAPAPGSTGTVGGNSGGGAATATLGANTGTRGSAGVGTRSSGGAAGAGGSAIASLDGSASLTNGPLGQTGVESDVLAGGGLLLLIAGEAGRRLAARRRQA